jgi:hypothetical protein
MMQNAILKRLYMDETMIDKVNYFSYICRMKRDMPAKKNSYIMTYNKLKPIWINGQLYFGIYTIANSVMKTIKNEPLTLHCKDNIKGEIYSLESHKWREKDFLALNVCQRMLLTLAKQGKTRQDMAVIMCLFLQTIDRERAFLLEKLQVKTITQAIIYATNRGLIYDPILAKPSACTIKPLIKISKYTHRLTPDIMAHIQTGLDHNQSVRSLSRDVHCSDTAIHKAITQGRLKKK